MLGDAVARRPAAARPGPSARSRGARPRRARCRAPAPPVVVDAVVVVQEEPLDPDQAVELDPLAHDRAPRLDRSRRPPGSAASRAAAAARRWRGRAGAQNSALRGALKISARASSMSAAMPESRSRRHGLGEAQVSAVRPRASEPGPERPAAVRQLGEGACSMNGRRSGSTAKLNSDPNPSTARASSATAPVAAAVRAASTRPLKPLLGRRLAAREARHRRVEGRVARLGPAPEPLVLAPERQVGPAVARPLKALPLPAPPVPAIGSGTNALAKRCRDRQPRLALLFIPRRLAMHPGDVTGERGPSLGHHAGLRSSAARRAGTSGGLPRRAPRAPPAWPGAPD